MREARRSGHVRLEPRPRPADGDPRRDRRREARLAVDRGLGSSLISRRFATELGIAGGRSIDVRGPTGPVQGAPATLDLRVGGGQARTVSVAIVDVLPDRLDGVIGLDFLWRFEVAHDRGRARASTPRP